MSTHELRQHLDNLRTERAYAEAVGLDQNDLYMHDLDGEYEACRHAYIGAAVTELASFRGQLFGRPQG
jgi:hypothetical protein